MKEVLSVFTFGIERRASWYSLPSSSLNWTKERIDEMDAALASLKVRANRRKTLWHVSNGSKREELNVSKSSPLCRHERTSCAVLLTSH
jgi:hypothetical protein